ncbi:phytoene desaturase family protein [Chitinivibrio alkaliphilus]|uniref:Phytoene desaturase n=1 Tax=Chitinivibrio alkaliphilus ACht1 TaxID=1313304 RepID=U7DAR8_9BACT|nr:NAD(P)/FAD-dependent oxidoreductase [Chitinivibrio alkaliphilus]ERP38668.1 phytoene desaturase [Chitinivibrio alkaliphilus ACht1]
MNNKQTAVVIGGGLGGLSAAISLANRGYTVDLYEKNDHVGGKLNTASMEGFQFDLGPSILTLPDIFRTLFTEAGKNFDDYCTIFELSTHWRNFFEDGTVFDFSASKEKTRTEIDALFPGMGKKLDAYFAYCEEQYEICQRGYFSKGVDTFTGMFRATPLGDLLRRLDIFRTMHRTNTAYFGNTPVRDAFDYFIKYVGASALDAPGFMNLLSGVQFEKGLWYVQGGLFSLSRALERLAREVGVRLHTGQEVRHICTDGTKATGVSVDGKDVFASVVVCNMEVLPALRTLTSVSEKRIARLEERFPPACSGIVIHLGVDMTYPNLAHHNFIYAHDQIDHFKRVFRKKILPDDPTLYVVASTRTDASQAPAGCENIKILPHIPPLDPETPLSREEYDTLAEVCINKLERLACPNLRRHIVVRDQWCPWDIQKRYYSNRGAIYGTDTIHRRNFALKIPKKSKDLENLWFVGGSVNPGGGMPMAVLSGIQAARQITRELPLY